MLNNATNFKLPLLTGKIVKGVVEDNHDPLHMGRLKVRVDGLHSIKMLTEDLPWVMSLEYFSNSTPYLFISISASPIQYLQKTHIGDLCGV